MGFGRAQGGGWEIFLMGGVFYRHGRPGVIETDVADVLSPSTPYDSGCGQCVNAKLRPA